MCPHTKSRTSRCKQWMLNITIMNSCFPNYGSCTWRKKWRNVTKVTLLDYFVTPHQGWSPICGCNETWRSKHLGGWDSSGGIATRYDLDHSEIKSRWARDFPCPSVPASRLTQLPIQQGPCLLRGRRGGVGWKAALAWCWSRLLLGWNCASSNPVWLHRHVVGRPLPLISTRGIRFFWDVTLFHWPVVYRRFGRQRIRLIFKGGNVKAILGG